MKGGGLSFNDRRDARGGCDRDSANITGGLLVTKKMLDRFKRPDDPPEFYEYYGRLPLVLSPCGHSVHGYELMSPTVATRAALGCIGGIAGLASQETARLGLVRRRSPLGLADDWAQLADRDVYPACGCMAAAVRSAT